MFKIRDTGFEHLDYEHLASSAGLSAVQCCEAAKTDPHSRYSP